MSYSDISNKKNMSYEEAKDKALRLLEFRSHSEKELRDKLKRAGAKEEDITDILGFCREYGFVDDERYAKGKAKDLKNLKKLGNRRIAQELSARGIRAEYIDAALCELGEDDGDMLYSLVSKKLGNNFEQKNIDKCIRYFMYRGYELRDIKRCVERKKGEEYEL